MRIRLRVWTLMIGVALLAGLLGLVVSIQERADDFRRLAAYHPQAEAILVLKAGGSISGTGLSEIEFEEVFARRGREEWLAMKASRYHFELSEKYRRASNRPWLPVPSDPPPPPAAHPQFEIDSFYYSDLFDESGSESGFK